MSQRRVIDLQALWDAATQAPGLLEAIRRWCRQNAIDPNDVPVPSEIVIEDSAFGLVIRYDAYLSDKDGRRYVDPEHPDRAAMAERTAVLVTAPPYEWTHGGEAP
ncbi:hypothetical protein AB0F46_41310 [Streptomyces sp. NPDC026665]|uniref:hypothetical protein n=1 Tax=Streptomyces sp. NPDC026665 TaxID=3154798 RepID=UPI0033DF710C